MYIHPVWLQAITWTNAKLLFIGPTEETKSRVGIDYD